MDILTKNNVRLTQSVYVNENEEFLNFPLFVKGNFSVCDEFLPDSQFYSVKQCEKELKNYKSSNLYNSLKKQTLQINTKLKNLKGKEKTDANFKQIISLRKKKKILTEELNTLERHLKHRAYKKVLNEIIYPNNPKSVIFNNNLHVSSFENICKIIPELRAIHGRFLNSGIPWFISDLNKLRQTIDNKCGIGVETGPCLFLSEEFFVILYHQDGSAKKFDYVDFKERSLQNNCVIDDSLTLFEYMKINAQYIKNVEVECKKTGITAREYDMIQYSFEVAAALNAKLVITIPDMSYRKAFYNIFKQLPADAFEKTREKFLNIFDNLSANNIKWINLISENYKNVDFTIFHYGEQDLCQKFYEKRKKLNKSDMSHISKYSELCDTILDYIFMPSLPYFLYDVKNIIEINRVEEWLSVFKCKKIYKKNLNLTALFPLRFSQHFDEIYKNYKTL